MTRLAIAIAALLAATACDRATPSPAPPAAAPESRTQAATDAPAVHATVARDGNGVLVVLDVALVDGRGRAVDRDSVRVLGAPPGATVAPVPAGATRVAFELRAAAPFPTVTVEGTSAGGARWSAAVDTRLDG